MFITNKRKNLNFSSRNRSPYQVPLFAMTDEKRSFNPIQMAKALPNGSILIFRHYNIKYRESLAKKTIAICQKRNIKCLIAGDIKLALKLSSDGVHLPQWLLQRIEKKPLLRRGMIITAATHSRLLVTKAKKLKLDAAILSPIFPTVSHPKKISLGLIQFASISKHCNLPIIALGGVSKKNFIRLIYAGAFGISGIRIFTNQNSSLN